MQSSGGKQSVLWVIPKQRIHQGREGKCKAELTRVMQAVLEGQTIDSRFDIRSKCCEPEDRPATCMAKKQRI